MKLYELTKEFSDLANAWINDIDEENNSNYEEKFNQLSIRFEDKAENIAKFVKSLDANSDAVDTEIKRLQALKKSNESKADWMTAYLKRCMEMMNKTEVKTPLFKIKIVKNPASVVVTDESKIPEKYFRIIPEKKEVDKAAIKLADEMGIGVSGAEVVKTNTRLSIK